jgi:hypothetical protein
MPEIIDQITNNFGPPVTICGLICAILILIKFHQNKTQIILSSILLGVFGVFILLGYFHNSILIKYGTGVPYYYEGASSPELFIGKTIAMKNRMLFIQQLMFNLTYWVFPILFIITPATLLISVLFKPYKTRIIHILFVISLSLFSTIYLFNLLIFVFGVYGTTK